MNSSQTLITFAEASGDVHDSTQGDAVLAQRLIIQGSEEIEKVLDRHVVTRGTLTEFHSIRRYTPKLYLNQWPILSSPAIQIYEDETRAYAAASLLTVGTDYLVDYDSGLIRRVDGASEISWLTGLEAIKVVYAAGYSQATVPGDLKRIASELFAMQWNEVRNNAGRIQTATDDLGTRTFFGPAILTSGMLARLDRHRRVSFGGSTYSRSTVAA